MALGAKVALPVFFVLIKAGKDRRCLSLSLSGGAARGCTEDSDDFDGAKGDEEVLQLAITV